MKKEELKMVHKRWYAREVISGRMSFGAAVDELRAFSANPVSLLRRWLRCYAPEINVTLPVMTEKERQKVESLQKQLKAMERELEDAQMKNIALETMIDIAEEQLKIKIRKKSGPKQ